MKQHTFLFLLFFFLLSTIQSNAQYNIATYTESFKTEAGVYGKVTFKIHPFTLGIGTLKAQATDIRILGVDRSDYVISDLNLNFPMNCRGCTFELTGVGRFSIGNQTYKGDFAFTGDQKSINTTQAEFDEVAFSSLAKTEHNKISKEKGYSIWEKNGTVKSESLKVFNVKGDAISEIENLISGNIRKAKDLAKRGDEAAARGDFKLAEKLYDESYKLNRDDYVAKKRYNSKYSKEEQKRNSDKAEELLTEGAKLIRDKEFYDGISRYEQAYKLTKDPYILNLIKQAEELRSEYLDSSNQYDALIQQGDKYYYRNDYDNAIDSYAKASKIDNTQQVQDKMMRADKEREAQREKELEDINRDIEQKRKELEKGIEEKKEEEIKTREEADRIAKQAREKTIEVERREPESFQRRQSYQDRAAQYQDRVAQQNTANTEMAATGAAAILFAAWQVGGAMYNNLGNTREVNVFRGDAPHINFNIGYTYTSAPIYMNSDKRSYDGFTYNNVEKIKNYQTSTLDLEAGVTAYPFYGERYGFGVYGKLAAGIGVLFQNSRTEGAFGFKGYYGNEKIQLLAEAGKGLRKFSHDPWLDAEENGTAEAKYTYTQFKLGLRYNFEMELRGNSLAHFEIAPLFELPDFYRSNFARKPTTLYWMRGVSLSLDVEHRLKIFMNAYWNYYRTGDVENIYNTGEVATGSFFNLGVLRNIALFEEPDDFSSFNSNDLQDNNGWTIEALTPTFNWIASRQDTTFNSRFIPSIHIINIEKDFSLNHTFSLFAGVGASLNSGGVTKVIPGNEVNMLGQNFSGGSEIKISNLSATLPVGLRIKLNRSSYTGGVPWLKVGVKNYFNISRKAFLASDDEFIELENKKEHLKFVTQSLMFGAGVDIPILNMYVMRLGITYDQSRSNVTTDVTDTRFKSIRLSYGLIF